MNTSATRPGNIVNVTEIVDNSPFTPLHWRAFILCMACLVMDGFDVQALGYTAPSIIREWGVANAALGPVFAAANFGVLHRRAARAACSPTVSDGDPSLSAPPCSSAP